MNNGNSNSPKKGSAKWNEMYQQSLKWKIIKLSKSVLPI